MLKTLFFIILAGIAGLSLFLLGRLAANRPVSYDSGVDSALAGNPLIERFSPPVERHAPPNGPVKLTNDPGQFLQLTPDRQRLLYYLPASGELRSLVINLTGGQLQTSVLVSQLPPNLKQINWSPDGRALLAAGSSGWTYYQLTGGVIRALPAGSQRPVFSPAGRHIAYLFFDPAAGTGSIRVADGLAETFKTVLATRSNDWQIGWLDNQTIALGLGGTWFALDWTTGHLQKLTADDSARQRFSQSPQLLVTLDGKTYSIAANPDNHVIYAIPLAPAAPAPAASATPAHPPG